MKPLLSRNECTVMRGLAILGIVLHNYCHFIGRIVKENEYQFLTANNERLWVVLTHPDELLPVHLLSYFGHYGVPVFLFLSGYGLVMKYEAQDAGKIVLPRFLRYNYLKLLRMLFVGFALFIAVDAVTPGRFAFHWENVLAQLLMVINVLPEPDRIIWPGIYWFFGLMLQLYILYGLVLYRWRQPLAGLLLVVVCWLLQALSAPDGDTLLRLRYNCIGGVLPFVMGVLTARTAPASILSWSQRLPAVSQRLLWAGIGLLACVATLAMSYNFHTWLWIAPVIVIGAIAFAKMLSGTGQQVFLWIGSLSAAMFVAHPIARKLFITIAWKQDIYDGLMLYAIAVIALSWAVKQILSRIPHPKL